MCPGISTITGDIGGAITPSAGGNINLLGTAGVTITGDALTNTLTITGGSLGTTNHAVQVGNATGTISSLPLAGDGAVLIGSSGSDPVFSFLSSSDGSVSFIPAAGALEIDLTHATTIQRGSALLSTDAEAINGGSSSKVVTPSGLKAKLGTQTQFCLPIGNGVTNALLWTAPPTDGQILIGDSSGIPQLATITAGAGTTINNGPHSIEIISTAAGGTWTEVTAATVSLAVNTNYIMNRATLITATLPAAAAVGDTINIIGKGLGLYTIAQNAGQTIHFGIRDTTPGVGGSLSSTSQYDHIEIVCTTIDTDFTVSNAFADFDVV